MSRIRHLKKTKGNKMTMGNFAGFQMLILYVYTHSIGASSYTYMQVHCE